MSGLRETFLKTYKVERTNKAEACREQLLWSNMKFSAAGHFLTESRVVAETDGDVGPVSSPLEISDFSKRKETWGFYVHRNQ